MSDFSKPLLFETLTDRELDILTLIAEGLSNPEIADKLIIGLETVRWHTKQIYGKLGVHSRTQASMRARDLGLLAGEGLLAVQSQTSPHDNLPSYNTPFIGRETELKELTTLLADSKVRLITIVGPGGMGKTRLAIELARAQLESFRDGVYFISLLSAQSISEIELLVANAINLRLNNEDEPGTQILRYLHSQRLLLVMDNFEHILEGAELVSAILKMAPHVKIIATSHMSLSLREEWVRDIDALAMPARADVGNLESYSSVTLFCDCVRRVRGDFSLEAHRDCVVRICQMVHGIPLAIELAAAWLKTLSCEDVAREIQHNIDFLATKQRDVEERHRSIQAVFEYAWRLLTAEEQSVFRRLSVFRGGFGLAAAEQVGGASIHVLSELVDKSLLQQSPTGLYEIQGMLREYAERNLESMDASLRSTRSAKLLAWAALVKGNFKRAEEVARAVLNSPVDSSNESEKSFALAALGMLAGIHEDYEQAKQLCEASYSRVENDIITLIIAHLGLSIAYCGLQDYPLSKHYVQLALVQAALLRIPAFSMLCLPVASIISAYEVKPESAVELMGLAFAHPDSTLGWMRKWPFIVRLEADLNIELGAAAYSAAWERGKTLNIEQVVEDLLTEL